jgi:hypothetical protein
MLQKKKKVFSISFQTLSRRGDGDEKKSQFSFLHRSDLTPSSFSVPLSKGKKNLTLLCSKAKGSAEKRKELI